MENLNNYRNMKHEGIRLEDEAKLEEKSSEEVTISNEEIEQGIEKTQEIN